MPDGTRKAAARRLAEPLERDRVGEARLDAEKVEDEPDFARADQKARKAPERGAPDRARPLPERAHALVDAAGERRGARDPARDEWREGTEHAAMLQLDENRDSGDERRDSGGEP